MPQASPESIILANAAMQKFGITIKRGNYTGGWSVANETRLANSIAHLLCNKKNYPIVTWMLNESFAIQIPEQFKDSYDLASWGYACGSAPRINKIGAKHVSKDAVKMGLSQEFVQWSQATRIEGVGGQAGLSRSVKEALQDHHRYGVLDESGNIVASSDEEAARMKAAQEQLDFQKLADGGKVSQFLQEATNGFTSSLAAKISAAMAAKQKAIAPAPKVEPPKVVAKPKEMTVVPALFDTAEVWEGVAIQQKAPPAVKRKAPQAKVSAHFVAYLPGSVKKAPPAVQVPAVAKKAAGRKGRK